MKKSLIWTAMGAAVIGVGVPAYAAVQTSKPQPSITTVKTTVEDISGNCDEAEHANDPGCATIVIPVTQATVRVDDSTNNSVDDATENSIDDDATDNSIDDDATDNSVDDNDATDNSVDDISGPCDEAEHANDPRCTGAAAPANSVDDNSGRGGSDDSGSDDSGSDDSGHGGSDD